MNKFILGWARTGHYNAIYINGIVRRVYMHLREHKWKRYNDV